LVWAVRDPIEKRRAPRNDRERAEVDTDGLYTEVEDGGVLDKRLLVVEGELASVLRQMQRSGNVLSPALRNLWDSGSCGHLTKTSPAKTHGAHIGLIAHISVDELRRELAGVDARNGFANRFLWAVARRSKCLPDGGVIADAELRPLAREIELAISASKRGTELTRDAEARELWHAVYPSLSEGAPGLLGAVTSRAEAQVLRVSVIYAALDCCEQIRIEHLLAALAVWDYCYRSAAYIFGDTPSDRVAERILRALRRAGGDGLSRTDIYALFDRHEKAARIDQALSVLESDGVAWWEQVTGAGRPAERWRATEPCGATRSPEWTRYLTRERSERSEERASAEPDGDLNSLSSLSSQDGYVERFRQDRREGASGR
jgi:hypothetical protein